MLHIKFQGHWSTGSRENIFEEVFFIYGHDSNAWHVTWTVWTFFSSLSPWKLYKKLVTTGPVAFILFYPITLEGRRGTTDEFATTPFHLDLFSAALVELAKSIPVHSFILSSHLFFCLLLFLFPFTVPCRIVFAKPEDLETWPNHLSFRFCGF